MNYWKRLRRIASGIFIVLIVLAGLAAIGHGLSNTSTPGPSTTGTTDNRGL